MRQSGGQAGRHDLSAGLSRPRRGRPDAAARLRHLADQGLEGHQRSRLGAGRRLPAPRHRHRLRQREGGRRRAGRERGGARRRVRHHEVPPEQGRPRARHAAHQPRPAGHRPRRPVADPLARRQRGRRGHLAGLRRGPGREAGPRHRREQLLARPGRRAHPADRRDPGGQPGRVEPAAVRPRRRSTATASAASSWRATAPCAAAPSSTRSSPASPTGSAARRPR